MRRALSLIIQYLVDSARSLSEGWNAFWYTPADPTLLGVLRILTGLMLLYTHAVWGLALSDFFGPDSWLNEGLVRTIQADESSYSFWWLIPYRWIWPAYLASMVILGLFTVGYRTRVTSVLSLFVLISFAHRVPEALFGLDQINGMLTLYLAIGPSGSALSVDRWLARRRSGGSPLATPSVGANFAQRLIQIHMCIIYFFAGASKLQGPAWWNGEAIWRAISNLEYQSADMTWLAWHPKLVNLFTHVAIIWEIFFCVLIWIPRLRPLVLAMAVAMHLGIGAFLGMWTFGLIMLVGCASFLPNEWIRKIVAGLIPDRSKATSSPGPFSATSPSAPHHLDAKGVSEPILAGGTMAER